MSIACWATSRATKICRDSFSRLRASGLQASGFRLQASRFGPRTSDLGPLTSDLGRRPFRPRTSAWIGQRETFSVARSDSVAADRSGRLRKKGAASCAAQPGARARRQPHGSSSRFDGVFTDVGAEQECQRPGSRGGGSSGDLCRHRSGRCRGARESRVAHVGAAHRTRSGEAAREGRRAASPGQ